MRIGKNGVHRDMLILSALAVAVALLFVPFAVHYLFEWQRGINDITGKEWERVGGEDVTARSFSSVWNDGNNGSVVLMEEEYTLTYVDPETQWFPVWEITDHAVTPQTVAWNDTNMSVFLPSPSITTPPVVDGNTGMLYHDVAIISRYTVADLIGGDRMQVKISWNSSRPVLPRALICADNGTHINIGGEVLGEEEEANKTATSTFQWDAIDLLEIQLTKGEDARLVFFFEGTTDYFQIGDQFQFSIDIEEVPNSASGWLTQEMILQGGAVVLGVVLIVLGLLSSPLWNPSQRYNQGIVDKVLAYIPVIGGKVRGAVGGSKTVKFSSPPPEQIPRKNKKTAPRDGKWTKAQERALEEASRPRVINNTNRKVTATDGKGRKVKVINKGGKK